MLGPRSVTEFNYRYGAGENAQIFVGFAVSLAAFALVSAIVLFSVAIAAGWNRDVPSDVVRIFRVSRLGDALIGIGSVGVLVFGIWLAIDVDGYELWDGWIIAAFVLWLALGAVGSREGKIYNGVRNRARELAKGGDAPNPELRSLLRSRTALWLHVASVVIADYRGIRVPVVTKMRDEFRDRVRRISLARGNLAHERERSRRDLRVVSGGLVEQRHAVGVELSPTLEAPASSGLEFLRRMRTLERTRLTPVAVEEQDGNVNGSGNHDQVFVSKGVKQPAANAPCTGFKPSANNSVSNFCWQQVGLDRLAKDGGSSATGDPTLSIDPSRNAVEPDIAFTGPSDKVAWTVWYEKDASNIGLRNNEQVFAAKIVADPNADGGFHWQAVGNGTAGKTYVLDTTGANGFGPCAASTDVEDTCSLNKVAGNDAEDPRVASGTLTPGGTTVPWVVWSEDVGGHHAIFVSRLVGGDHFELFNAGNPVSAPEQDAGTPDITFYGNTPYISWTDCGSFDKSNASEASICMR